MSTEDSPAAESYDVAVLAPVRGLFSYAAPADGSGTRLGAGIRVWVPFGRSHRLGIVIAAREPQDEHAERPLKPITEVLDEKPRLGPSIVRLARWAASYYHHPPGEVFAACLPTLLRKRHWKRAAQDSAWRLGESGREALSTAGHIGPRQRELMEVLQEAAPGGLGASAFETLTFDWRATLRRLVERGWVERFSETEDAVTARPAPAAITLNAEQHEAVRAITASHGHFESFVLHGVTGSGKTEVYFECIDACLERGEQALVLVPEIALTGQLVARFQARFGARVRSLHSGLGARQRALTWEDCAAGRVSVLIGTRSAVWVDMPRLALIVVDEEHDASYKQQEGFRYSGRDIAIMRASEAAIPVILGSATPSLESLANVARGKYRLQRLTERALAQPIPRIEPIDVRGLKLEGGLSEKLLTTMREHLQRGEQVMLFLNRRGFAPLLICRSCGEPRRCDDCDAYLVFHKHTDTARCHHCDRQVPMRRPVACCENPDIAPIGLGTEKLEEIVQARFPDYRVCRMDRDSVRHAETLEAMLDDIAAAKVDILIGTQMVAKGFDFGAITLVGIVDADSRLYALDFRAEERLAQLLVQVAGRAGRADKPGRVLIQTHQPEHPVLRRIIEQGYDTYSELALRERSEAALPPFQAMAILRAESNQATRALEFLGLARAPLVASGLGLDVSYPIPALMERRAGRYRALLVISTAQRPAIGHALERAMPELEKLAREARVRFAIDIDPQDTL